jgi:hypothetical protein
MLYNPYIRDLMTRWFPDGKVAEPLTYYLMYPNQQVWDIVHQVGVLNICHLLTIIIRLTRVPACPRA